MSQPLGRGGSLAARPPPSLHGGWWLLALAPTSYRSRGPCAVPGPRTLWPPKSSAPAAPPRPASGPAPSSLPCPTLSSVGTLSDSLHFPLEGHDPALPPEALRTCMQPLRPLRGPRPAPSLAHRETHIWKCHPLTPCHRQPPSRAPARPSPPLLLREFRVGQSESGRKEGQGRDREQRVRRPQGRVPSRGHLGHLGATGASVRS